MALTNEIDRQLLLDILTDGFESWSSKFWAQVKEYKWQKWYKDADSTIIRNDIEDIVLLQMRDRNDEGGAEPEWTEWHDITIKNLEEATQWALVHYNHLFPHFAVDGPTNMIDEIDYDAIGADIILQKIVLGDVVYG